MPYEDVFDLFWKQVTKSVEEGRFAKLTMAKSYTRSTTLSAVNKSLVMVISLSHKKRIRSIRWI